MDKFSVWLRRHGYWRTLIFTCSALFLATAGRAADVWVVQGRATGGFIDCAGTRWEAGALFHNESDNPAVIRAVHLSSDSGGGSLPSATIPPHGTLSLTAMALLSRAAGQLSAVELDVPNTVATEARLELFQASCNLTGAPLVPVPYTILHLPVATTLTPPGQRQIHYGVDLGGQTVRLNVTIYNAGAVPAFGTVTLERSVCDMPPLTQPVMIPADSVQQVSIPSVVPCTLRFDRPDWASNVAVVLDQPSFSFVSTLTNASRANITTAVSP